MWAAGRVGAGAQRAAAEEVGRAAHAEAERLRRQLAEAASTSDLDRQFKEVRSSLARVSGLPCTTYRSTIFLSKAQQVLE